MGRPDANSANKMYNPIEIRLLTHLRLGLIHLSEHKFKHSFVDCVNPLCSCGIKPEATLHFFPALSQLPKHEKKLFDKIKLLQETLLQFQNIFFKNLIKYKG